MSDDESNENAELRLPRATATFFGHSEAEQALLDAYRSGRMHHAWLLGGPPGIGKATLAYRFARFLLAHPDPSHASVQRAASLSVPEDHPAFRRVAAQAHTDLLTLERTRNDNGVLRTVITVDEVRRTTSFFGSTAGEGGWRVCIVDVADELQQPQAVNALLKIVEEPPRRAVFLLVSNASGRLLPTIRSRCRRLIMRPLGEEDVRLAAAAALDVAESDPTLGTAAAAAEGSVARAIELMDEDQLRLRAAIADALGALPSTDGRTLHALGERISGSDPAQLHTFADAVGAWLSARLHEKNADRARLARLGEAWEKVAAAARDVETYNLDRKPFVFEVFGLLTEAVRH